MKTRIFFGIILFVFAGLTGWSSLFGIILDEKFHQYHQYSLVEQIIGVLTLAGLTGFYASLGWFAFNQKVEWHGVWPIKPGNLATKVLCVSVYLATVGIVFFGFGPLLFG